MRMRVMLWKRMAWMLAVVALCAPGPALAGELEGVEMPEVAMVQGRPMLLNGMGLRDVFIVDVYVAGLYLPTRSSDAEALLAADEPWRVVLHFLRDVDGEDICEAWMDGLDANTPDASEDLRRRFDILCDWMPDVAEGQELEFVYMPGAGTTVTASGAVQGTMQGLDFAHALMACWIGPKPGPGEDFKNGVLGLD